MNHRDYFGTGATSSGNMKEKDNMRKKTDRQLGSRYSIPIRFARRVVGFSCRGRDQRISGKRPSTALEFRPKGAAH